MSRRRNRTGVPDRWLDYRCVGRRLCGTRFIAFKVPLKQSLNRQLQRSDAFGPWELQDATNKGHQQLGLIIDLTFTTRYYSLKDVPESLLVVKILTAGHDVPTDDTILSFKRAVRRFLRNNSDNDKLIGVHCTHGVNRTGYLICRYLIDVDGMDPTEAVALFNSSRGHAIERQNYLEDLRSGPKRSNEGMDESQQEPMRGCAKLRSSESDDREERRPRLTSCSHRSFPPRGTNHRAHNNGFHPGPPLPPSPHPYQWAPPHPVSQWRRPPCPQDSRSRYLQAEPEWRWRPPPPPPPLLPRYSPRWESNATTHLRSGRGPERDMTTEKDSTRTTNINTDQIRHRSARNKRW